MDNMTAEQAVVELHARNTQSANWARTHQLLRIVEQALTAPRVPEGWRDTLEKVRDLVAESQVDAFGVGHIEACSPFPIRDEIVDSLTKLLAAAPAHAESLVFE